MIFLPDVDARSKLERIYHNLFDDDAIDAFSKVKAPLSLAVPVAYLTTSRNETELISLRSSGLSFIRFFSNIRIIFFPCATLSCADASSERYRDDGVGFSPVFILLQSAQHFLIDEGVSTLRSNREITDYGRNCLPLKHYFIYGSFLIFKEC